jgi:protein-tyrosine phosphatase
MMQYACALIYSYDFFCLQVYVHCNAGASRAPAMVMAYLISVRKISLIDAYEYMQSVRILVQPNKHFLYQLAELEVRQVHVTYI